VVPPSDRSAARHRSQRVGAPWPQSVVTFRGSPQLPPPCPSWSYGDGLPLPSGLSSPVRFGHPPLVLLILTSMITVFRESLRSRRDLALENLALRQQLAVL